MTKEFKVIFHSKGFDLDSLNEKLRDAVCAEFMSMYDMFAKMANEIQDKINDSWQQYEEVKLYGNEIATKQVLNLMGLTEEQDYNDWCEKWYLEICKAIDFTAKISRFHLISDIFRDGSVPVYGAKFKDKPEWKLYFTLEPVD